jgi:HEAT repeat protein
MTFHRPAAVFLVVLLSATALAKEKYTIHYVEITPLGNGGLKAKFVEKQAELKEVLTELRSKDKYRRFSVIRAIEDPETWAVADRKDFVQAMGQCLQDDYLPVRIRASQSLGLVGPDAAAVLPALIKATEDEELFMKVNAIRAMANIGPGSKAAIPVLTKLLEMDDTFVPMHAGDALARIGPEAVPALIEALKSKKSGPRFQAIVALGSMGTEAKTAIPALKQVSTNDEMLLRFWAKWAIEEIGHPSTLSPPRIYGKRKVPDEKSLDEQKK